MSSNSDSPKPSNEKLSLRRETVRNLGVRSGIKTGEKCTMDTMFSCKTSGPCTFTMPPTIGLQGG